ncbi:hypothetical protein BDZ89DRAFT_178586 [Hymenopellis radicata]|nr:hypothetical protein BDZ89DRAFT_178586 [Hymenopellis radicata]
MWYTLLGLAFLSVVSCHYTFPDLIVNGTTTGDWQYVRMTENHYSNGPVTDVTSAAIRCYELDATSAGLAGIARTPLLLAIVSEVTSEVPRRLRKYNLQMDSVGLDIEQASYRSKCLEPVG